VNEGLFLVRRRQGLHPGDRASGTGERGRGTRALELKVGPAKSVRRLISRPRSKQSPWRFAPFHPGGRVRESVLGIRPRGGRTQEHSLICRP
jgi:hypothetical protein